MNKSNSLKIIIEKSKSDGWPIDPNRDQDEQAREYVRHIFSLMGNHLAKTARFLGMSVFPISKALYPERFARKNAEQNKRQKIEKLSDKMPASVEAMRYARSEKRCIKCGRELPKKPVCVDGQMLTRLCYHCWKLPYNFSTGHAPGLFSVSQESKRA